MSGNIFNRKYIPFHQSYSSIVTSTILTQSTLPSVLITDDSEKTEIVVKESGLYTVIFNSYISLMGNLQQSLVARVNDLIIIIESEFYTNHALAEFGGQTLAPGFYEHTIGAATLTGNLTLSGDSDDIWVFNMSAAFTPLNASSITLSGGALPQNVFWLVTGAFTVGTNASFSGIVFGKAATSILANSTMDGRLYSTTGLMTIGDQANIINIPPNDNERYDLGPLYDYMMFGSGNITRAGVNNQTNFSKILTSSGTITNFGSPYDGIYTLGTVQPLIYGKLYFYKNGVVVTSSEMCIKNKVSECNSIVIINDIMCNQNDVIDVRMRVLISDTSGMVHNRILNMTRRYE
jgi:hypothetical protein